MDRDLNRSVRLLEDALSAHGKSLLRTGTPKKVKKFRSDPRIDLSLTLTPAEMQELLNPMSMLENTEYILHDATIAGSVLTQNKPWENASEALYMEYLDVIQSRTNVQEIFETVSDLARCCTDTLTVIRGLKSKVMTPVSDDDKWLENERNTWRLIYCLYQDRLNGEVREIDVPETCFSEKLCIESLYKRDSLIRESQLIIDWLECNAFEQENNSIKVQHFTDKTVGWENTLHQLQASESIVFRSSRPIVSSMDPDAPFREKLPLHDLDMEDEERLCKKIFREIRCGRKEEAQLISIHCGHPWRATILEGWHLYHDPNLNHENKPIEEENEQNLTVEKIQEDHRLKQYREPEGIYPIEGNVNRDLWKLCAWKFCKEEHQNIYEKATLAAFCGCLQSLLPVCENWEDLLWAYMKTMVDIRVESEIRDYVSREFEEREYEQMPGEYWNNKMSLDEIFEKISATKHDVIRRQANSPDHLIQKFIILDQIPQLMLAMEEWINSEFVTPQFLRFLAHLVLFLKQIAQNPRDDIADKVLESYVKCLMKMNEPQLVAYYAATLGQQQQIKLYAAFLKDKTENEERKKCLQFAEEAALNVRAITKTVVESIISEPEDMKNYSDLQRTMNEKDKIKISALDWVLFDPTQTSEAIYQCNTLVAHFLTMGKIDAAKLAFSKIPVNAIDLLLSVPDEEIPENVQRFIREHLCYKAYLDAHESFNDWFKYFHHSRPVLPPALPENATFTEKVAHEHRISQHKAETERWKLTVSHLAKTAKTKLYNVLLFPDGGWLHECDHVSHLRSTCIPETVILLYSVLSESGNHVECVQLADILAAEKYQLYKAYSTANLEDILKKIFESSIVLLDEKKDMWGTHVPT